MKRVLLRADLVSADAGRGLAVSAKTGQGISTLVSAIRDALVPPSVLADPGPWRFWG